MTEVLTDDRTALENQQSNTLPFPPTNPIHSFLLFLFIPHCFSSLSYQHSVPASSFVPSALLLSAIFVSSFLCPLLLIPSPGWRKALPPQLCQVCPLSHDVPGRRGNVLNRWEDKMRGEPLSFPDRCLWPYEGAFSFEANRHKNRLAASIEWAVPCKYPDGLSVSASLGVCVHVCIRQGEKESQTEVGYGHLIYGCF